MGLAVARDKIPQVEHALHRTGLAGTLGNAMEFPIGEDERADLNVRVACRVGERECPRNLQASVSLPGRPFSLSPTLSKALFVEARLSVL